MVEQNIYIPSRLDKNRQILKLFLFPLIMFLSIYVNSIHYNKIGTYIVNVYFIFLFISAFSLYMKSLVENFEEKSTLEYLLQFNYEFNIVEFTFYISAFSFFYSIHSYFMSFIIFVTFLLLWKTKEEILKIYNK